MTYLPSPRAFRDALRNYAEDLRANFATLVRANPEDQLKAPVQALLRAAGTGIITRTEAQVDELGGRPDIGVAQRGVLCGFVELKAPGKGARARGFRGADRRQFEKFRALPNLIYTDGSEWALYREGEARGEIVRFGDVTALGADALDDEQVDTLYRLLVDFLNWQPIVPNSPGALAETLAPLCRLLREDVRAVIGRETSNLAQLAQEWRQYLFPDADDDQFADAYAQTLTYALLLARLNGEARLTTARAAANLDSGHGLLAQTLRVLTQPEAREEISTSVDLLERVIAAVNPDQLRRRGDPWLYFYEHFLAAYDPVLRRNRGVYYTPMEVIRAKVNLVAELLETKFDKPFAVADEGVTFLDPAAGTAAYPVAAVEHALEKVEQHAGPGAVAASATECARNINAFELLVGPYAVAHLRLTQMIVDAGGTLPREGVQVFLTDTLESPNATPPQTNLFARRLTEEHRRAQRVKRNVRVLVCMGNPPYEREEREQGDEGHERKGGWVRHGDPDDPHNRPILRDFIDLASDAGAAIHVKNLYNDYVYFWRWALWKLFENPEASGPGIVAFITASSYLRGPGFVGMRQKMRECFDELWILDLEGGNLGARRTENVFAIQTPVAIAIGVRYDEPQPDEPAVVRYAKIIGTRQEKLERLEQIRSFEDIEWRDCFRDWMQPFLPEGEGDYFAWPLLTDVFPWQHSGVQFKRTWPIGETREVLHARWNALLELDVPARRAAFRETGARRIDRQYPSLENPANRLPPISTLSNGAGMVPPVRYAFRSFDRQWVLADPRVSDRLRTVLWQINGPQQLYMTSLLTGVLGVGPAATVSSYVPDLHHFRGSFGGKDVIPLWRDAEATQPNITHDLLEVLGSKLGQEVNPEDLFCYCYALLASPAYVEKFSEELTTPGPRIPITRDPELFRRAVDLGRTLIWLHTYGERFVPARQRRGRLPQGRARNTVGVPTNEEHYPETFSYDPNRELLRVGTGEFYPVAPDVWDFSVSGYRVLESWLSYRRKAGYGRTSSPLDHIRPAQWTAALRDELLNLIWVLEATVDMFPELEEVFSAVLTTPTFAAADLPQPEAEERQAPADEEEAPRTEQDVLPY